jgi:hypothetical protein
MTLSRLVCAVMAACALLGHTARVASAQVDAAPRPDDRPAFSLSSSEIFTTHASPYVTLTFERLGSLDFRVYRVVDPFAFFARLKDPHTLGSET